jgi:aryl-alcohol dehydrogenase-like predicted oxidoreductase
MQSRPFGRTGQSVHPIGFGAWAIGGAWGSVDDDVAVAALHAALDAGLSFIDTADVYGDGHSEQLIARVLKARGGPRPFVATKAGRRLNPHVADGYREDKLNAFVDRSLRDLDTDCLDLVQLHCPPTEVYYRPEVFAVMDRMVTAGKIRHYGVSVERVEEALKAIEFPNVASVQIIFNMFRQRPAEHFFELARKRGVAIIARVPLASGLLTGKLNAQSRFEADDHRQFNRNGEAFDVGETFSGIPYDVGLAAVERVRPLLAGNASMAQLALRWILMFDAVSVVIPGARNPQQALMNIAAAEQAALSGEVMDQIKRIYDEDIRPHVHQRW